VYNQTLAVRKAAWEQEKRKLSYYDTKKMLPVWKVEKSDLRQVHSQVLQNITERVELAFQAFFRRVSAGQAPGYPRFKGRGRYASFTYPQSGFSLIGNRLRLSKIGEVKIRLHRPLGGSIKTLTIRRDKAGNWSACFSCILDPDPLPPTDQAVGIDLGLTTFATFSDGKEIERQRWMKRDAQDIARLQRKKERLPKGSAARKKAVRALGQAYQRQTNRRNNFAHQESRQLINAYQFIALEDLDIKGMQSQGQKTLNRGMADVAWGRFVQYTAYKAECAGRSVVLVDPKGTTQRCSGCGLSVPKDLHIRRHACPHCGLKLSRDLNSAKNILARGLASLRLGPIEAHPLSRWEQSPHVPDVIDAQPQDPDNPVKNNGDAHQLPPPGNPPPRRDLLVHS
jgi:putative transposase